jgi:tetratricopeptide (TPR) repeat protein
LACARIRLIAALVTASVSGCAVPPPPDGPAQPAPAPTRALAPDDPAPNAAADGLVAFEAQQRDAAEAAARQGRWADAIWACDIVLALRPGDSDAMRRRAQADDAVRAALPERLARGRAARSHGDIDAAARAYLQVLALAPDHAAAAEALREIERERVRRYQLGQSSRAVMARRAPVTGSRDAAPAAGERNEIEHASMLAGQGEINGAIAMLQPLAEAHRGSATLRALLADLYVRQAEQLATTDRAAAITALELSLQADPTQPEAAQRLRELRETPASTPTPAR